MNHSFQKIIRWVLVLGALGLWNLRQAQAQPGGGFQQFGGGQRRSSSSSSSYYPGNSEVGDAVISIDPETRSLIVIADDRTREYISQVVSNLDRPKPQVLIKVVFMEISHNNSFDFGIEGGWGKGIGNSMTGAVANAFGASAINNAISGTNAVPLNMFGQPTTAFQPMPPGAGLYQLFAADYQVTLRAIAQAGKAKVLSRPSIIARNNQPATITVGQEVPLVTGTRFDNYGNAINTYNYQSVGIILRVTPFITTDGMVEMILSPETSELIQDRSQWVPVSSTASAPIINERSADTVVVTPDGQTVIIGGLMYDSKAEAEYKVPFLGDVPLLGTLFKRKIKNNTKTELLIFLTPYIVNSPNQLTALSASEQSRTSANKAFTEKELNAYIDNLPTKEASGKTSSDSRGR